MALSNGMSSFLYKIDFVTEKVIEIEEFQF